jgi:iron complex transport system substrate-binding protein
MPKSVGLICPKTDEMAYYPERIICMTEEFTEILYLLGEQDRIVGISGFTMRPPEARKEKPKVALFTDANIDRIKDLRPDLILGFSDIQADLTASLIREGLQVCTFNQRSVRDILQVICMVGAMVGKQKKGEQLAEKYSERLERLKKQSGQSTLKPKVYFEEWMDPLISGIRWVSELIEIAGGEDVFPENAIHPLAKDRILPDPTEVISRNPDIIIGSWCGKMFKPDQVRKRRGWSGIKAVKNGDLYEINSTLILQPGPAALTDGLDALIKIIEEWKSKRQ